MAVKSSGSPDDPSNGVSGWNKQYRRRTGGGGARPAAANPAAQGRTYFPVNPLGPHTGPRAADFPLGIPAGSPIPTVPPITGAPPAPGTPPVTTPPVTPAAAGNPQSLLQQLFPELFGGTSAISTLLQNLFNRGGTATAQAQGRTYFPVNPLGPHTGSTAANFPFGQLPSGAPGTAPPPATPASTLNPFQLIQQTFRRERS
jgi:hypothetical protein